MALTTTAGEIALKIKPNIPAINISLLFLKSVSKKTNSDISMCVTASKIQGKLDNFSATNPVLYNFFKSILRPLLSIIILKEKLLIFDDQSSGIELKKSSSFSLSITIYLNTIPVISIPNKFGNFTN